jgi:uncharacterized protein YkwD
MRSTLLKLSRQIVRGVLLCCGLGLAGPAALDAQARADGPSDYAQRVLQALNAYRAEKGLPALLHSPALHAVAATHSDEMAARQRPSHEGFAQRVERTGGELCVENVAHGFRVPEQVLAGWRRVSTHDRNLLEPGVRYVGMANHGLYITYFACDSPH